MRRKELGRPDQSHRLNLLYWYSTDATGLEAERQRRAWDGVTGCVQLPVAAEVSNYQQLLTLLGTPQPSPATVIYLYCQATASGQEPGFRFGNSLKDVYTRIELAGAPWADHPLVFANACSTIGGDPYRMNQLEASFFGRECRAYIGTETKVPVALASRVAMIFFDFFERRIAPEPMAAGEALAQTRLYLWTRYRNVGGLFYGYTNRYAVYRADQQELAHIRV
jgi:hypothetical protein